MKDISNTSVIIHYRKDSEDRVFNFKTLLRYLNASFTVKEILIALDDATPDKEMINWIKNTYPDIIMFHVENDDEFMKALSFNHGAAKSTGDNLAFWDVDTIIDPEYVWQSVNLVNNSIHDHVFPYNGRFYNVHKDIFDEVLPDFNFKKLLELKKSRPKSIELFSPSSTGGCNIISREAFERMKGYDDRFIGWGYEDTDYHHRSQEAGNRVIHLPDTDAVCWHLQHDNAIRGYDNGHYQRNIDLFQANRKAAAALR